jgi:hypothetical protein
MKELSGTITFLSTRISVVDPNPKESEYFDWIRIRKKSSDLDSDSDPDTVVKKCL